MKCRPNNHFFPMWEHRFRESSHPIHPHEHELTNGSSLSMQRQSMIRKILNFLQHQTTAKNNNKNNTTAKNIDKERHAKQ